MCMTRSRSAAAVLVAALGLSSCAMSSPGHEQVGDGRRDDELYEANVQAHVDAMVEGMARARLDLARRALSRMLRDPG